MSRVSICLTVLLAVSVCPTALAGDAYYYCQIINTSKVANSGLTVQRQTIPVSHSLQNKFVVNRKTGAVMGGVFANEQAHRVDILDAGSSEQAFKLLSIFGPHTSVDFLQIQTFKESDDKPFSGMSQGRFYSGLCQ